MRIINNKQPKRTHTYLKIGIQLNILIILNLYKLKQNIHLI